MTDDPIKQALQNLIDGQISPTEIDLLQQQLASRQISIGGDANHSVIILGDGNIVNQYQLTPEMVDLLTRRKLAASVPLRDPIVEGINLLPYDYDQRIQNFLREYLGDAQRPVPFGGRDEALHTLNDWLIGTTPYMLLTAPAGHGKSALLVRWLDSLRTRENIALAFVPVSVRFGTNMERVFYAALAARLAFLHGDDVPASSETSTPVYRGLVSDYLAKPLSGGRTLLVVLDGLDEAADWQAGADFLSAAPPAGVRVLVSARGETTQWRSRLNWDERLAAAPSINPLDRPGVADVLAKMGCPLDELGRNVDIVGELHHLSEGDPLLVGLYVGDLWRKSEEVTRLKPEDLAKMQLGYKGYFDRWWDDQKSLWGKEKPWLEKHVLSVRKLLAAAFSPLLLDDLQALAPALESDHIRDALAVLQRFVIGDGDRQGYTFNHPKLGQYFWETLSQREREQLESCFLSWCKETLNEFISDKRDPKKKADVPAYVVRNYGVHLTRAGWPIKDWLPLIHQQVWAQAWFSVEGSYGGYLQDVQRVWERCKVLDRQNIEWGRNPAQLAAQVRCGLIETSLHSLAASIPVELIPILLKTGVWTLAQTWVSIRQIPDPKKQSRTIIKLLGDLEHSQLPEALTAARTIGSEMCRADILSALIQYLPKTEMRQILTAAQEIRDEGHRANVLGALSQSLPKTELGQVLVAVRSIEHEESRAKVLSILAQRMPELSGEALTTAMKIGDESSRVYMMITLAQRLPKTSLGELLAVTREIRDARDRADVLSALSQRMPEIAREALTTARQIRNEGYRALVLSDLAQHLPEIAREALTTAQQTRNEYHYPSVLSTLAQRLPETALGELLAAAREISNEDNRADVLSALVQRMPETSLGELLAVTREIKDARDRADVLSALSQRMPEIAREALTTARQIRDEESRASVLRALVPCIPEASLGELLTAAWEIRSERNRAHVLSTLAQRLPEIAKDVLTMIHDTRSEVYRAVMLSILAQHVPQIAREALTAVQKIRDQDDYVDMLSTLAKHLPETALGELLTVAREIKIKTYRARLLSALVQRLPELSVDALVAAKEVRDENDRFSRLSTPAENLAEPNWEALVAAGKIREEEERAHVLRALAQRLPELRWDALTTVQEISDEGSLISMLSTLAQHMPETSLGELVVVTREIGDERSRARVLSALAQHLPETSLGQILADAREIRDEYARTSLLSALAQYLSETSLGGLLADAMEIRDKKSRAHILSTLVGLLTKISKQDQYILLEKSLPGLSLRTRADLFSDLSALMPIITHLGTDDTPREIYEAVRDVTTWWP